jgi:hypothetical protein
MYATVPSCPLHCVASHLDLDSGHREYFQASSILAKRKRKKSFLEGLEVNKLLIVIAMQEGIIHGGISLSRFRQL